MKEKLISVIIPAYNCDKYILESLNSILYQSYSNIELLIADDASTDNTRKIIDALKDSRIKTYHNKTNKGYLKTCNILLSKAKGELIAFQDADDISDLNRFKKQIDYLNKDLSIDVLGTNAIIINSNGDILYKTEWEKNVNKAIFNFKFHFSTNSWLFKRNVYDQIGGYNKYFKIGFEDFYWAALIAEKYKIINMDEHLYFYRKHKNSISSKNKKKLLFYYSLIYVIKQRRDNKTDYAESHKYCKLKSIIYRKLSSLEYEKKMYKNAIKYILKALMYNPVNIYNIRTLIYYLKSK
jgi:glycosyltransferase involved in cell wall biosynthesis